MAVTATATARGLPRLSPAMVATGMAVTATGTATARGLPRPSPATDTAMVVMAMAVTATATARGPPRLSPATDTAATAMDTATTVEDAPHTTKFNTSFCDRLRIFNYVS